MQRNYESNESHECLRKNVAAKAANACEWGNARASQFVPINNEVANPFVKIRSIREIRS